MRDHRRDARRWNDTARDRAAWRFSCSDVANRKKLRSGIHAANNYAFSLAQLKRSGEAKALLRRTIPVARRALGENNGLTLKMRWIYAKALYDDPAATLDDLREAMTTLEDAERIARRVLGSVHPMTTAIEEDLRNARAALRARETPPPSPPSESA